MSVLFLTGFEHGIVVEQGYWTTVSGSPTIQGTVKRSGNYAFESTNGDRLYYEGFNTQYAVGRFYFRCDSLPDVSSQYIYGGYAGESFSLFLGDDGILYWYTASAGSDAYARFALSVDTWYRIDFRINGTGATIDWMIDGMIQPQYSGWTSTGNNQQVRLGVQAAASDMYAYYDDFILSDASADYPWGAGKIVAVSPNGDGTHNNTNSYLKDQSDNVIDGASYYANLLLDEVPLTSTSDYVKQTGAASGDYVEVEFADLLDIGKINGVMGISGFHSAGTNSNNGQTRIRDSNGQETTIQSGDMADTSLGFGKAIVSIPSGGWTQAHLNALKARLGYSTDVDSVPYWDALMLEVDYKPSSGITPTWLTGFEYGVLSTAGTGIVNAIVGSCSVQGTVKRSGNYALKINPTSNTAYVRVYPTGAPTVWVGRFYVRYDDWNDSDNDIVWFDVGAGNTLALLLDTADRKVYAKFWSGPDGNKANVVLSLSTWYRIDFKLDVSANPNTIDFQVNGVAASQTTYAQAATYFGYMAIGNAQAADTFEMYVDDFILSETADDHPIGEGQIIGLSPDGAGTSTPGSVIQDNGSSVVNDSTNPANVELDEVPLDSSSDYIKQTGTGNYFAEVTFEDMPSAQTINGARGILAYTSSSDTANNGKTVMEAEDFTDVYDGDMGTLTLSYKSNVLNKPLDGWIESVVNAIKARVGYSTNVVVSPYWQALMVEVDYVPSAGGGGGSQSSKIVKGIGG